MTLRIRAGLVLALLALLVATVHPQEAARAPLAGARLDRIGIAARDANRTAKTFAALLGIQAPKSVTLTADGPGGRAVRSKTVALNTVDFRIEINQPVSSDNPTQEFLKRFGPGIEYIGFTVDDSIANRVRSMERMGGVVALGNASETRALVSFSGLGLSIDLRTMEPSSTRTPAAPISSGALAARKASHVGFVYRDAQPALTTLASLLGVQAPALAVFKPIDYRSGDPSDPAAHVKFAQVRTAGVSIEFIEPVGGPSPWFDFVNSRRGAAAAHHVAFAFGAQDNGFDTIVRHLQSSGGRWRKGKRGFEGEKTGSSPELEFLDTLGLVIEVTKAGG